MANGDAKPPQGSDSTIVAVFVQNVDALRRFLRRFFTERQDIDDITQEAFLRAYVAEQRRNIDRPRAYIFRIARNLALTKLEHKSRQIACYLDDAGDYTCETGDRLDLAFEEKGYAEAEDLELLGIYCDAIASLPPKCRQVFLLRKVHGLSHREIADRMALSVSSVEKYLLRGVLECRAYMERKGAIAEVPVTAGKLKGGMGEKKYS